MWRSPWTRQDIRRGRSEPRERTVQTALVAAEHKLADLGAVVHERRVDVEPVSGNGRDHGDRAVGKRSFRRGVVLHEELRNFVHYLAVNDDALDGAVNRVPVKIIRNKVLRVALVVSLEEQAATATSANAADTKDRACRNNFEAGHCVSRSLLGLSRSNGYD